MNSNNYTELFEQFLKEGTADFRMYPSKRVWTSIYNNIHPSKRWPSITTCLIILLSILFIGNTNSKTELAKAKRSVDNTQLAKNNNLQISNKIEFNKANKNTVNPSGIVNHLNLQSTNEISSNQIIETSGLIKSNKNKTISAHHKTKITSADIENQDDLMIGLTPLINNYTFTKASSDEDSKNKLSTSLKPILLLSSKSNITDNYISKLNEKSKNNISYQVYATPSIGYRNMNRNTDQILKPSSFNNQSSTGGINNEHYTFNHAASWNLEAGGAFLLSISKFMRVKAGMQLNYTNYKIHANGISNSDFIAMQINDPYNGMPSLESHLSSIQNIANYEKSESFNSNTYQISLPIGTELELAGNENFKWFAAATIQPSYLVGGNPYLISADMKNYINDPSFYRRWNLNSSIETFLSYKLNNGAILNAGPQFRYQLLSTYDSRYIYNEKLYNIGIKLGISRNF